MLSRQDSRAGGGQAVNEGADRFGGDMDEEEEADRLFRDAALQRGEVDAPPEAAVQARERLAQVHVPSVNSKEAAPGSLTTGNYCSWLQNQEGIDEARHIYDNMVAGRADEALAM